MKIDKSKVCGYSSLDQVLTIGAEPYQTAVGFMKAKALLKIEKLLLELLFMIIRNASNFTGSTGTISCC